MTKALLDAQYALFKAQMQYEQASPGKVEVIEELVSKVGKLLEDEKAENGRRCYNTGTNGTEASSEEAGPSQISGAREAAVEEKLEFFRMMSQLQTTRDSLILDTELYDIVGRRVHQLCEYAGSLPTGPFMEFFSELPSDILGLLKWLQLRPRHAPLLNTLMEIMESCPETDRGHQGLQPLTAKKDVAEHSDGQSEPYVGYIKAFVPTTDTVHSLLLHALSAEHPVASSEAPINIPSTAVPATGELTPTMISKQGVQPHANGPAYKPYSIKPASINGNGVVGPPSMVAVASQGVPVGKLSPLPAPLLDTPLGVTASRRVSASVTPVDRHVHEAAAAAAEADDTGSDDDFHDPLQGLPYGRESDEPEQDLPAVNLAADMAHTPLPCPTPGPVDSENLLVTSDRVSETDSEDALLLGEARPIAERPKAQPDIVAEGQAAQPAPQPLSQPAPQLQSQVPPKFVWQERPLPDQQEKPGGVSGPARAQQQEPKRARMEVTAEEGKQEAVASAAQPNNGAASDGKIPRNGDASTDDKMSFTQGHDSKGVKVGKSRKVRMAAAKRAAEARRPVVPGAEPAENPPAPAGATTGAQRAKRGAKQLHTKPSTPTQKWADEPVEGEHANEAEGFHDDRSSICDSHIVPRSEASQDSRFNQGSLGRQASNDFESRYPTVHKPLLSDAVATAFEDKMRKQVDDRLEQLRQTWNCKKLFIGNLGVPTNGLSEDDLQSVFRSYNCIHVKICRQRDGLGHHKCYGFLTFDTPENAFRALKDMHGTRPYPLYRRIRLEPVHDPNYQDNPPSAPPAHPPTLSSSGAGSQADSPSAASAAAASEPPSGAKHLFMSNVGSYVTEKEVYAAFANYNLVDVRIPQFADSGRNRHFAFLTFTTDEDGYLALQEMNGSHKIFSQYMEEGIWLSIHNGPKLYTVDVSGLETLETRELYMGNLDYRTTAEDIHEVFKDYDIKEARVPTDPERGGVSRGFAFLTFATEQEALRALKEMNRKHLPGSDRTINLNPEYSVREPVVIDSLETPRLYMGNLDDSTTEDNICEFFKEFGIEKARVITNRNGVSRGFAFLTFNTVQEALRALKETQGQHFPGTGRTIKLNPDSTSVECGGMDVDKIEVLECPRLFIGNIYDTIRERDIIEVFQQYHVESVRIIYDRDGLSKHFGFLTFRTLDDAWRALKEMNGRLFPGTNARIKLAPDIDAADGRAPAHARAHVAGTVSAAARSQSPGIRQARAGSRARDAYKNITGGSQKKEMEEAKSESSIVSTKSQGKKGAAKAVTSVKELSKIVANPFAALVTDQVEE
ncbi:g11306 [Coccomyxa elongata]